ncbi:MAG: cysteine desulfurase-like protein [Acidobacteriota bacterium]
MAPMETHALQEREFGDGVRPEFPIFEREIQGRPPALFDGPGGSQVPRAVIEAVSLYYRHSNANTHGAFVTSRETDAVLEEVRQACAAFLRAPGWETISFGANMTTLAFFLARALGRMLRAGDEILVTQLDHEANRGPWLQLRELGLIVREVAMTPGGHLDYDDFAAKLTERTRITAVGWASNALGTVNNLTWIRERTRRVGSLLVVDAVHYAPHFSINVRTLDPDFLLCSAYKFYGPHVGILYGRPNLLGQLPTDRLSVQDCRAPWRIETGTLNHAAIAGVGAAIRFLSEFGEGPDLRSRIEQTFSRLERYENRLARRLWTGLAGIPSVQLYGPDFEEGQRAPTIAFRVRHLSPQAVAERLAEQGIFVWDGDFYAARAIELLGLAQRGGVVRAGVSMYTTEEDVDRLLEAVDDL